MRPPKHPVEILNNVAPMETSAVAAKIKQSAGFLGWGMALIVLGAKLGLIHYYGTDEPFADQWAAEGVGFLQAPLHGGLNWASFFWPHGEHRPAITRLITRGLILGNAGQWDCYVEIVFNLSIYAAFLAVAWRIARQVTDGWRLTIAAVFMAALFSAPCAYENILWGFQSQFVFLLFCGALHVYGTARSMRIDGMWVIAQLAAFCGLFSIAAGVMSPAAITAFAIVEVVRGRRDAWAWATIGVNIALLAYGLWLLPVHVPSSGHGAELIGQALVRTGYLLAWPFRSVGWGFLFEAPCIGAIVLAFFRRGGDRSFRLVALLWLWIFFVAFAIAYGRFITAETIGVRYFDVLLVGIFANGLGVLQLWAANGRRFPRLKFAFGAAWFIGVGVAFWQINNPVHSGAMLRQQKEYAMEQKNVVRGFLSSDNVIPMREFENRTRRFPHFDLTLKLLRDPEVRPLLSPGLSTDARKGPLSRLAPAVSKMWGGWMGIGVCLLLFGARRATVSSFGAVAAGEMEKDHDWD